MPRFLIEVPHEAEESACLKAARVLAETGSHYLTNAEFGCNDGVHKGWLMIEVENKRDAQMVVPPAYRNQATIVELSNFKIEELDELLRRHRK